MTGYGHGPYGAGPYGVGFSGGRITWDTPTERLYETGLDRGVLYLNDGSAVPWNGLIGVEEAGGDSASPYYFEGRPFLWLQKVKDFAATINAYTYPDEFAAVMGVEEATYGMYLDSQMGDTFGLSYRTLIGDAINGTEVGYKIHLVYNATVVPSSISYGTLSDSVNPIEFSWDIKTVAMPVIGFYPTAHVILDTRHMSAEQLAELELMLYGDEETPATLPSPQEVLDLMEFGDSIVITDNGDGTWTAQGSYNNVFMVDDDEFQINNVDAVNHGDGTFTVSSTP